MPAIAAPVTQPTILAEVGVPNNSLFWLGNKINFSGYGIIDLIEPSSIISDDLILKANGVTIPAFEAAAPVILPTSITNRDSYRWQPSEPGEYILTENAAFYQSDNSHIATSMPVRICVLDLYELFPETDPQLLSPLASLVTGLRFGNTGEDLDCDEILPSAPVHTQNISPTNPNNPGTDLDLSFSGSYVYATDEFPNVPRETLTLSGSFNDPEDRVGFIIVRLNMQTIASSEPKYPEFAALSVGFRLP